MKTMVSEAQIAFDPSVPERNSKRFRERISAIIPKVAELISKADHKIGISEYDEDRYEDNHFIYDQDGWNIEIEYRCCGKWYNDLGDYWNPPCTDLICAWGDVSSMSVSFYDEDTDDQIDFSSYELKDFHSAINKVLRSIA